MIHAGGRPYQKDSPLIRGQRLCTLRYQPSEKTVSETDKHAGHFPQCQDLLGSKFTRYDAFNGSNLPYSRFPWAGATAQWLKEFAILAKDLHLVPRTYN